jgi:hydrogenase expression/formation protein HypC
LCEGDTCIVELDGVRKQISLALVEEVAVGDHVIVHVGYALSRLDTEEAERTLALFAEVDAQLDAAQAEAVERRT